MWENNNNLAMPIHFDSARMRKAFEAYNAWWQGKLDRPLISITLDNVYPNPSTSRAPLLTQATCTDFSYTPEEVVAAIDDHLSTQEYLGDAFPFFSFDIFGPGALAAFCGALIDNSSGRVWFVPDREYELQDLHVRYNPDNKYVRRIKDIYRAGIERWQGSVIMGLPDIGGVLDVLATFRGTENLLMDLITDPEEVTRLCNEIQSAWYEAYDDFYTALRPQGLTAAWSGALSDKPSYIMQCDFSYMISNEMFRQFAYDTLLKDTQRIDNTIYHLDGEGALRHLDDMLSMPLLNAVQWVPLPNDVKSPWMHVYKKIVAAGKRIMLLCYGRDDGLDSSKVIAEFGNKAYCRILLDAKDTDVAEHMLNLR